MTRLTDLAPRPQWLTNMPSEKRLALENAVEEHAVALAEIVGAYVTLDTLVAELWAFALAISREVTEREIGTPAEARPALLSWIPR
jgi:hypothetical protein